MNLAGGEYKALCEYSVGTSEFQRKLIVEQARITQSILPIQADLSLMDSFAPVTVDQEGGRN